MSCSLKKYKNVSLFTTDDKYKAMVAAVRAYTCLKGIAGILRLCAGGIMLLSGENNTA